MHFETCLIHYYKYFKIKFFLSHLNAYTHKLPSKDKILLPYLLLLNEIKHA